MRCSERQCPLPYSHPSPVFLTTKTKPHTQLNVAKAGRRMPHPPSGHTLQTTIPKPYPPLALVPSSLIRAGKIVICNGNRTEWSQIRSVIIRVINKTGRPRSGSPICLITSMITDRIGRHEVLLPINHNFNKICNIIGYFLNKNTRNSKFCFASSEKKPFKRARDGVYYPIT